MRVALLIIPATLLTNIFTGVMVGAAGIPEYNLVKILVPLATVAGLLGLLAMHASAVMTVVAVSVGAAVLAAILAGAQAARRNWLRGKMDWSLVSPLLAYGSKTHLANLAGMANERADVAVISLFLAPAELGYYSVAVSIAGVVVLLGGTLSIVAFPALAGAENAKASLQLLTRFVRVGFAASLLLAAVAIPLCPLVVHYIFGVRFEPASGPAIILLLAGAVLSTNHLLSVGLRSINRPLATGVSESVAFVVTVGGLLLLVPLFGILGAAFASIFAYMVSGTLMVARLTSLGVGPGELLVPRVSDLLTIGRAARTAISPLRGGRLRTRRWR
jgi:O-antigen/teichoic acid export membrane protein